MEALSIAKGAAARTVYTYDLPAEVAELDDEYVKKSLGFAKLSMDDEIAATQASGGNQTKLAYRMVIKSLVEVDGRPLNKSEGEDERVVKHCDPIIRELMLQAYADISAADQVVAKKFLGSRKTKIG